MINISVNSKQLKILVLVSLLVLFGSFLVTKIALPAAQDLPREMENGKNVLQGQFDVLTKNVYSYTEPNQPFANHHWLSGVVFYLLYIAVSWDGMVVFKVIFILLTFLLLFYLSLKRADFWLVALFSIPTIFILISRTALRPEMFSYFFVVIFLYLFLDFSENPKHNRIFWLIPLQLLWVNMHILFVVGILMAAGFLMEKIVLNYKNLKGSLVVKKFALVFLALVLVIFINPYGLRGAIFSFQVNSDKSFPVYPAEITTLPDALKAAPGLNNIPGLIFYYVAILLAISFIVVLVFRFRKKQFLFSNNIIFYFAASLGSGALGYFVIRGLPMFGLIFLPVISENLNKPFIALKEWLENKWSLKKKNIIGIIFVLLLILSIVWLIIFSQQKIMDSGQEGLGLENWSLSSEKFFKDNNIKGPIFNDTDIGSYLIYYFYPKQKVFTDNRFGDAYSAHFFADIYLPLLNDDAKWQEGLARYNFNAIFFYHYDAAGDVRDFLYKRIYDKDWAWVYADSYAVILIRRTPENKGIIDKFEITKENVAEKLKYLSDSKYSQDQIAAADIFNLIGRFDLSMPAYLKFVSRHPGNGKVWMVLGKTELTKSDQADSNPYLAAIYLERAISEGWKTWESYSYLALAYYRTGQLDRAKAAVKKELSIDPGNQDGEKWLGTFANQAANSQ